MEKKIFLRYEDIYDTKETILRWVRYLLHPYFPDTELDSEKIILKLFSYLKFDSVREIIIYSMQNYEGRYTYDCHILLKNIFDFYESDNPEIINMGLRNDIEYNAKNSIILSANVILIFTRFIYFNKIFRDLDLEEFEINLYSLNSLYEKKIFILKFFYEKKMFYLFPKVLFSLFDSSKEMNENLFNEKFHHKIDFFESVPYEIPFQELSFN